MALPTKSAPLRQFASDNQAGMCPEVIEALAQANLNHAQSYGGDRWTRRAIELIRDIFETKCEVFLVFNGTAANSLAMASLCKPYESVLCHKFSHVLTDECNAPGFFAQGTRLVPLEGAHGKINPAAIESAIRERRDVHHSRPGAVTITQATEMGTVYSAKEVRAIAKISHKLGLHLHMDGARFANATSTLGISPRKFTWEAGVDVLTLGGTKNGMAFGEAVVFFNRKLAEHFEYRRKQSGQLASKMRFLATQWIGLLKNDVWLSNATHANKMANLLARGLRLRSIPIVHPAQANAVFASLPQRTIDAMHRRGWHFYTDVSPGDARLMCSWDTQAEDIEVFLKDLDTHAGRRSKITRKS